MNWQTIKSAPKDERVIAAWYGSKLHTETSAAIFHTELGYWCNPEDSFDKYGEPDMWMPWPEDPPHPGEEYIDSKFPGGIE